MPVPSATETEGLELPGWAKLLLVLAVGVAVSGMLDFALSSAGYGDLAALVWAMGYAGTLIIVWLVWGQHLELVGDTGVGHDAPPEERSHTDEDPATDAETPPESY